MSFDFLINLNTFCLFPTTNSIPLGTTHFFSLFCIIVKFMNGTCLSGL